MVTITEAKLRQNVYETVYDLINAITFSVASVTVTAAFIDDEDSLPQVVINPANVDRSNKAFGRGDSDEDVRVEVEVWTTKNKDKDVLTDEIFVALDAATFNGMMLAATEETNALDPQNENKIHMKNIVLMFVRRG